LSNKKTQTSAIKAVKECAWNYKTGGLVNWLEQAHDAEKRQATLAGE